MRFPAVGDLMMIQPAHLPVEGAGRAAEMFVLGLFALVGIVVFGVTAGGDASVGQRFLAAIAALVILGAVVGGISIAFSA